MFLKRPLGAPFHTLSKLCDVPIGLEPPLSLLRLCIALLAVAEGSLLLVARYRVISLVLSNCFLKVAISFTLRWFLG